MKTKVLSLLAAVATLVGVSVAEAATTPNSVITGQTPTRGIVQFLQGTDSAGTYKTLYTAGSNGSKCMGVTANTNDGSAAHLVTLQLVNGGIKYGLTAVNVPINSGFASGIPPVSLWGSTNVAGTPTDSDVNNYIYLSSGDTLQATFATALTASDVLNLIAVCTDF